MNDYIIEPLFDNILVEPEKKQTESAKGILLPESASGDKPQIANVIAVGLGRHDKDGNFIPMILKAGDRVMYKQWGTTPAGKTDGVERLLLKQDDVLARVKKVAATIEN